MESDIHDRVSVDTKYSVLTRLSLTRDCWVSCNCLSFSLQDAVRASISIFK